MAALAYPLIFEAGEILAYTFQAFAVAVPIVGLALTEQSIGHFSHPDAKVPHTHGRDISDIPSGKDMDFHYDFESPVVSQDTIMGGVPHKRPTTPIETPRTKRVYEEVDNKHEREVKFTGPSYTAGFCRDFSGIQRTRVNPVSGRIIGYKGIRRKRALSNVSKYSEFWRQQKYAKTSFHAARSPGVWDSARR